MTERVPEEVRNSPAWRRLWKILLSDPPPAEEPEPERGEDEPLLLRPEDVARLLSVDRTMVYQLIAQGDLRAVKIGRLTRIPRSEVEAYVARLLDGDPDSN